MVKNSFPEESEFLKRWFAAVAQLTPEESADILVRTSNVEFMRFMRQVLPAEEYQTITEDQLHALHDEMCRRLEVRASKTDGTLGVSGQVGRA